jgi:hypothetical protein
LEDLRITDPDGNVIVVPGPKVIEILNEYFENEDAQNEQIFSYNPYQFMQMKAGGSVDQVKGATGEFGRSITNPIPVNGALGQQIYLSKLRTETGERLLFHRLGSESSTSGMVDLFEVLSFDGKVNEVLYLNLYFSKRSTKTPKGYKLSKTFSPITGTAALFIPEFPLGYRERVWDHASADPFMQRGFEEPKLIEALAKRLIESGYKRPKYMNPE